jgi:hypothetical protein
MPLATHCLRRLWTCASHVTQCSWQLLEGENQLHQCEAAFVQEQLLRSPAQAAAAAAAGLRIREAAEQGI